MKVRFSAECGRVKEAVQAELNFGEVNFEQAKEKGKGNHHCGNCEVF